MLQDLMASCKKGATAESASSSSFAGAAVSGSHLVKNASDRPLRILSGIETVLKLLGLKHCIVH